VHSPQAFFSEALAAGATDCRDRSRCAALLLCACPLPPSGLLLVHATAWSPATGWMPHALRTSLLLMAHNAPGECQALRLAIIAFVILPVLPRWAMPLLLWRTCSRVTNTPKFVIVDFLTFDLTSYMVSLRPNQ
jgi:hypothetical protein